LPIVSDPKTHFCAGRNENAVAFPKAGNAKLNETGHSVNDGQQTIKIRFKSLTVPVWLNGLLSKKAAFPSSVPCQALKPRGAEA
jgi:hypothetical protein